MLDARQRVYTSSAPLDYHVTAPASSLPAEMRLALAAVTQAPGGFFFDFPGYLTNRNAAAAEAGNSDDGSIVGYVLLSYEAHKLYDRVGLVLLEVVAISVPGLLILVPLGWVWGNRIVKPLTGLAAVMRKVGHEPPAELARQVEPSGSDETGQLASQFRTMLYQLDEKEQLERQVLVAERLAAVGRVSAGIAHEINNPLGGMLNAVDTLARHGSLDSFTQKTLGLLQRGLAQIRSTVGALLLEARWTRLRCNRKTGRTFEPSSARSSPKSTCTWSGTGAWTGPFRCLHTGAPAHAESSIERDAGCRHRRAGKPA